MAAKHDDDGHEDQGGDTGFSWRRALAALILGLLSTSSQLSGVNSLPDIALNPSLTSLPYCGLSPSGTLPYIPPCAAAAGDYDLAASYVFGRHGHRYFMTSKPCWTGQDRHSYDCSGSASNTQAEGTSTTPDSARPRRFRTRRLDSGASSTVDGNCALEQLTPVGMQQEKALGDLLRQAYVGVGRLLSNPINVSEIAVRATNTPRALSSARALISGMFDMANGAVVDILTADASRETMIPNSAVCPDLAKNFAQAAKTGAYQRQLADVTAGLRQQYATITQTSLSEANDVQMDCLTVSACWPQPLPTAITLDLLVAMQRDAAFRMYSLLQFPNRVDGARLAAGPLLQEIVRHLDEATTAGRTAPVRFRLYVGHDIGPIMNLLSALSVDDGQWPPLASYIALELYRRKGTGEASVRLIYNGKALQLLPSYGELMSYTSFRNLLLPMIPSAADCPGLQ